MKRVIVTGGAGFIGSAVIRHLIWYHDWTVLNIDKLTYAGNLSSLKEIEFSPNYTFLQVDIENRAEIRQAFEQFRPEAIIHLAAQTHVDRSIDDPGEFIQTNIVGTYNLLESAREFWQTLDSDSQEKFRFHHVSTDEVYGATDSNGMFTETTPYDPRSPYSASKAASDHLVKAWFRTYRLPVLITNCSNNYGPYHFPEKLIPLTIINAIDHAPIPVYGRGENVRDWLYVEDHVRALVTVLLHGKPGESYNIGGHNERRNIDVVRTICSILDEQRPWPEGPYSNLITFVTDRPGHDLRYAIDATKLEKELGWYAEENFESGIRKTVQWYLQNEWWWRPIREKKYTGERLGKIG